jgi:hypothetical protein
MPKPLFDVKSEPDVIVVTRFEIQTAESVRAIRQEILQIIEAGGPKDILVITKSTGESNVAANQESVRSLDQIPYRRVAIVGTIPQRLAGAQIISKVSTAGERVRIFRSEEDARTWLKESRLTKLLGGRLKKILPGR